MIGWSFLLTREVHDYLLTACASVEKTSVRGKRLKLRGKRQEVRG
jgi:hypothetical protein